MWLIPYAKKNKRAIMNVTAIYPGTFDPITNGHLDLILRASNIFDRIVVAVAENRDKSPLFDIEQRVALARGVVAEIGNVEVIGFDCLLVECARNVGARVILRGLRAVSDFEYEFQLAWMNRRLSTEFETIFMTPAQQYAFISSSMIREIAKLGGNVADFVPEKICAALVERYRSFVK